MFLGSRVRAARRRVERIEAAPPPARQPLPFGLEWAAEFLPHYLKSAPSRLHRELAADLRDLHLTRGQRRNYIAPRGAAKTTWVSKAYPLWCLCERIEPFILLLSDTEAQANSFLTAIKAELEGNPALLAAYPATAGVGPEWQASGILTRGGGRVVARGAGGRIRGLTHRDRRPTLVVIDDPNKREDCHSPTMRRRVNEWIEKDVLPVGEPGTNFVAAGTTLHREAAVCRLANLGGWQTRRYKSILSWPHRADLWAEWQLLFGNIADDDRAERARAFYAANKQAMDDGAEVLWPERFPLVALYERLTTMGPSAFDSEFQDHAAVEGGCEWDSSYFDSPDLWYVRDPDPADVVFRVQALDPSKGSVGDRIGDRQAHVCATLTRDGLLWFEAVLRREDCTAMVATAAELARRCKPNVLCVEVNGTMGLLASEFERVAHLVGGAKLETITHTNPKAVRIRRVGQYLARHRVRVRNTDGGRMLVDEWRDWPGGEWDDAADAAAQCVARIELECGA